ncbi:MAG TPA: RluA family pseudouridine synthase [Polyangiaceae bacterium]|jgi:23S rRNA pseudouridine1911/1915/1917 synthase
MHDAPPLPAPRPSNDVRELVVPASLDGSRLDKAIAQLLPDFSRARVKRAIELGAVRVNGRRAPKGGAVATGDALRIDVAQVAETPALAAPDAPLKVVLETEHVVVVDKPANQPTAPLRPGESGTLVNAILGRYPELLPLDKDTFIGHSSREPGIIHRLDTETSGAVIVARTAAAFDLLKAALKEGRIDKRYLLVCSAEGLPEEGTIEFPLTSHPKDERRVHACIHPRDVMRYDPRPARTVYRIVKQTGPWALVEATVERALRHQIRAHFAAIGHPLAGDELYGGPVVRALGRHALHAARVAFGGSGVVEAFDVDIPLPKDIAGLTEA